MTAPAPLAPEWARRVWIENIRPSVDGGRFPIKRTVGEEVAVRADVFCDGHDTLAVGLRYRPVSSDVWLEVPMRFSGGDTWRAEFTVMALEPHEYTICGWVDRFASWQEELRKKAAAGMDVSSELLEGAQIVETAGQRATGAERDVLLERAKALRGETSQGARATLALAEDLASAMARYPDRSRQTVHDVVFRVDVDRQRARFGAWYEMFPRSEGRGPSGHGSFREAEGRLPAIAGMGFDVLYLPPIHPIGRSHRKGPNNTLRAAPEDPGSPWAIGSEEGGHTAIHPQLGTLDDFAHFVAAARGHGLEVAMDLAFQCSPDHPYVREHPEWFRHRPDGSIKYAENPPKRYEDIYPLDFESPAWASLWLELCGVVRFWADRGIRLFRVDNPHTKPLRFWQWLIAEIRSTYPEAVFLAEAFTRPKVMHALAKAGFNQSYTYFTWRNTKREIVEYLTELTGTEVQDYFRPNFFTNTPDILPEFLQFGGRPAFEIRLVLAATLGASYGVYSGFELCENEAVAGTEEYLNSEKFQIRPRHWDTPDSLASYIARANAIRRENPALAFNHRLRFHEVDSEHLLAYSKSTRDLANIILVVVNLDPNHPHEGHVEVPLETFGLREDEVYQVHDLLGGGHYLWQGRRNYVRLDPQASAAQIFRLRRRVRTEHDFDYFM